MNPQMMDVAVAHRIREIRQQAGRALRQGAAPSLARATRSGARWPAARSRVGLALIVAGLRLVAEGTAPQR